MIMDFEDDFVLLMVTYSMEISSDSNAEESLEAACTVLGLYLDEQTESTFEDNVMTTFDCGLDGANVVVAPGNRALDVLRAEATVTSFFPAYSTVPSKSAYEGLLDEMVHSFSDEESLQEVLSSEGATLKLYSDSDTEQAILEVEHHQQEEESLDVSEANEQEDYDSPADFSSSSRTHAVFFIPFASAILLNILLL